MMAKGIIVVDIPGKCNECRFWFAKATVPVEYRCMGEQRKITEKNLAKEKPDWCPIKSLEDMKDNKDYTLLVTEHFRKGWNACIEEIERR